jgi:hypothetical protein
VRFLLRVDSHARNHSAHPQAQSQVAALRACAAARSARVLQRRAPRVSLGATCGRRRALHQPCARELGRAQLGRPLSPQRQVTCTEGRHWSFAAAGCGHDAEEGRDTASARRVLRRQASFEAAWPQLTATDCLHVSRLYRYRGALRAHRCQRAPRVCLASALRACVQLARSARVSS